MKQKTINSSPIRAGRFTSSEIANLLTVDKTGKEFGKPAITYIAQTNKERRLGRSLTNDVTAHSLSWGKAVESHVFNLLGLEYSLTSQETDLHPVYGDFWAGSKDGEKEDTVIDIKCPMTLDSFCGIVDPLYEGYEGREAIMMSMQGYFGKDGMFHPAHKSIEDYFWQLVSNAIINNKKYAELIVYVPFKSELDIIKAHVQDLDIDEQWRYKWIYDADADQLPHILDNGYYNNLNVIRFEVTQEDRDRLTEAVVKASNLLIGK
jgi:hypothetical protein